MMKPTTWFAAGIHETGEWFPSVNVLAKELRLHPLTVYKCCETNSTWNGLHFYMLPRPTICRVCGKKIAGKVPQHGYICGQCIAEDARKRARAIPKEIMAKRQRCCKLKTTYGLSEADFERMVFEQGGVCACCGKSPGEAGHPKRFSYLFVDHDHKTGKVRGLLCHGCNSVLGHCHEDPAVLEAAIVYLKKWNPVDRKEVNSDV